MSRLTNYNFNKEVEDPRFHGAKSGHRFYLNQQLEKEIMNNSWLVCPFASELLYEVPFEKRWLYAGKLLGIDMNQLSSQSGHA